MKWLRRIIIVFLPLTFVVYLLLPELNTYQSKGELTLSILQQPVTVKRDAKQMAYIYAENKLDAVRTQGFVTAQDRLFQMQITKFLVQGRLAEFFGEAALDMDKKQRTLGFYRAAQKHTKLLGEKSKSLLQAYTDGVNEFILNYKKDHHLEFKLAGIQPEPWSIQDSLAIMYYMGWGTAGSINTDILSYLILNRVGLEKFKEIYPLHINPDENADQDVLPQGFEKLASAAIDKQLKQSLMSLQENESRLKLGSNNWAVKADIAAGNNPMVVNDPHLATDLLPTLFYPVVLITPGFRAAGAVIAGIPGLIIGRNEYLGVGVTNAYGDSKDLFIETRDKNNADAYMEGDQSIPFKMIQETIKIKDSTARNEMKEETFKVFFTKRGPIVSDVLKGLKTNQVISLRWAALENMQAEPELDYLLTTKSVSELRKSLSSMNMIHLNYVFADKSNQIGWQTTGSVPVRDELKASFPVAITSSEDLWKGMIPFSQMPQSEAVDKNWIGTANHKTVTGDYPYYYSSWFSPNNRYRRIKEVLNSKTNWAVEDHWNLMRDDLNVSARNLAPVFAKALKQFEKTRRMGDYLAEWDYQESTDSVATTIYQTVFKNLVKLVYSDELGEELMPVFLESNYYWQQRLEKMILSGDSEWFDNIQTEDQKETLTDLIRIAGKQAALRLSHAYGDDMNAWTWGKVHRIEFLNPIRRKGSGKEWLGGGNHPIAGSGDTIHRAKFNLSKDEMKVKYSASLRMVVDLNDDEKVTAVIPGGIVGRTFSPYLTDQIEPYLSGEKRYWWFSDQAIEKHTLSTLELLPN